MQKLCFRWCSSRGVLASVFAVSSLLASGGARAVEPPYEPNVHDGFYMRLANGLAVYDEQLQSEDSALYGGEVKSRTRGIASVGEFAIGGTVAPGLVLGGGIYTADLVASTFKSDKGSPALPPAELDPELRNLVLVAPFVDVYPNVRHGFHGQAALGLAVVAARVLGSSATDRSNYSAIGGGLMLGAGYEWWVGDEWSLGILGRATINVLTGKDESDVRWIHVPITSPSFMVSLTYH